MTNAAQRWYQRRTARHRDWTLVMWYYALECGGFDVRVSGAYHDRPTQ